jgi:hypothetical protein
MTQPLLCRLKLHDRAAGWSRSATDPCLGAYTCRRCGEELETFASHSWGEPESVASGHPCAARVGCTGCGAQKPTLVHAFDLHPGDRLPIPRRPLEQFERTSCFEVEVCGRCKFVGSDRATHDFGDNGRCRRCDYFVNEA